MARKNLVKLPKSHLTTLGKLNKMKIYHLSFKVSRFSALRCRIQPRRWSRPAHSSFASSTDSKILTFLEMLNGSLTNITVNLVNPRWKTTPNILRQGAIAVFAHLEQILQCFLEFVESWVHWRYLYGHLSAIPWRVKINWPKWLFDPSTSAKAGMEY